MKQDLLNLLCDPEDQSELTLHGAVLNADGSVESGELVSAGGHRFPIRSGIPRFVSDAALGKTVDSFGDEWNYFNYDLFKTNWLNHVVANTFGSTAAFAGKTIVDCGAGSGMQSRWMAELGARRVIALELSHSVDHVMKRNLAGTPNVDVVQCSIDQPPLKRRSIDGIVICHNVIQHTPSVEATARALWSLVAPGGEFVFNCYMKYPDSKAWMLRWLLVYRPLRAVLSRCSFNTILLYAKVMAALRFVPLLGWMLEKAQVVIRGDVPAGPDYRLRQWKNTVLNTYDWYGSHAYQHQKSAHELQQLLRELQPDERQIRNASVFFSRPLPPGTALRVTRT